MAFWWRLFLIAVLAAVAGQLRCSAYDFDVGGDRGWAVPPQNNSGMYNQWASKNRFKIGDSLVFKYKKDSVMVVGEEDYGRCNAEQPILFYNNGETEINLDHTGTYYFISGLREHCQRGQKMILKVLSQPEQPEPPAISPPANRSSGATPPPPYSASSSGPAFCRHFAGLLAIVAATTCCF